MKRLPVIFAATIALLLGLDAGAANYVDSQVVCQVIGPVTADSIARTIGAVVCDSIGMARTYLFSVRQSQPLKKVIETLLEDPSVVQAQPNYYTNILDLEQTSQPFVDQTSQPFVDGISPATYYAQYANQKMSIDSALTQANGQGMIVAVIDGGVDINHPLFHGRLHPASRDFVDNDDQPWGNGNLAASHGTFTAGIIARSAPKVSLLIIRSFDASGGGTTFHIAQGIYHAILQGAQVINMSFGMNDDDVMLSSAIATAMTRGIIAVAAAGNQNLYYPRYPAAIPGVLSVASVDASDKKASFSNFHETVCVTAPGVGLYGPLSGGDVWGWWDGTSFSAAFASGLAALVKEINPDLAPDQILQRIRVTTDSIDALNPEYYGLLGSGRLDYYKAVYTKGDANRNNRINIGDAVFMINYVFKTGPPPYPLAAGDVNCDGLVGVGDIVYMINYTFKNGPKPHNECN
jgi:subtilisin family serine protease